MRILCLIPSMGAGGAERTMARLVSALSERHDVTVMTYDGDDCEPFYALPPSVQLVHTGLMGGSGGQRLRRIALRLCTIRRLVRQTAPDVVLSFITTMNITAIGACLGTGVPVLVSERIDPHRHRLPLMTSWLRLLAYTLADGVVVQTARVRDFFPSWLRRRITILPNPVPLSAQFARPHVAGPHGRMRIIAIGRLVHQKGFDRLISAFARVSEQHPNWDLVIFGEGEDRAALTAQVAELGLGGRVSLPGITDRVEDELAASHLMALPSRYEGFPNALAEAMAAALPSVAFAGVSGVEELVFHGKSGFLADDGSDELSLASSLDHLMGDGALRRRFGTTAREHAQNWPPDLIHAKWEQILMSAAKVGKLDGMTENRFEFGENWQNFLNVLDDQRIAEAEKALADMAGVNLAGRSFLDIGSGSGLMSLAARRLGARVHSFDYDTRSVACTAALKQKYFPEDPQWRVEQGSVLDRAYLATLGRNDVVYSWGVLHHTGDMWQALANVDQLVSDQGTLFIAIYNDQGWPSRFWLAAKRAYNRAPRPVRLVMAAATIVRFWTRTMVIDSLRGEPLKSWHAYHRNRGMSPWHDAVDWIGGLPFEVAKPEQIFDTFHRRDYVLTRLKTCAGGMGCNEFVFRKAGGISVPDCVEGKD